MSPGSDSRSATPVRTSEAEDALHVVCYPFLNIGNPVKRFSVDWHKYRRKQTGHAQNILCTHNTCSAEHWRATGSAITCAQHPPRQLAGRQCPFPEYTARREDRPGCLEPLPDAGTSHPCLRRPPQATARQGGVSSAHRGTSNVLPAIDTVFVEVTPYAAVIGNVRSSCPECRILVLEWLWRVEGRDGREVVVISCTAILFVLCGCVLRLMRCTSTSWGDHLARQPAASGETPQPRPLCDTG